jgi:hypothetical protein
LSKFINGDGTVTGIITIAGTITGTIGPTIIGRTIIGHITIGRIATTIRTTRITDTRITIAVRASRSTSASKA